jgi:hypothetical protein
LSGHAPKPHSNSVETTFSAVSAITNQTAARANAPAGCGLPTLTAPSRFFLPLGFPKPELGRNLDD